VRAWLIQVSLAFVAIDWLSVCSTDASEVPNCQNKVAKSSPCVTPLQVVSVLLCAAATLSLSPIVA